MDYWNLFWTTGMPEAWLMSRNGKQPAQGTDERPGDGQPPSGPLGSLQPHLTDRVLGGPMWPY